jgi:hypothetical protein
MRNFLSLIFCLVSNLLFFGCDKGPDLTTITQEGKKYLFV